MCQFFHMYTCTVYSYTSNASKQRIAVAQLKIVILAESLGIRMLGTLVFFKKNSLILY